MKIAIDAMGGDNAPASIVQGAIAAAGAKQDMQIVLVGRKESIRPFGPFPENVSLAEASGVIENDDKPLMAIRQKRDSSLVVALNMLKEGAVDGMVSAGNTGAYMAGASLIVGRIPGVAKPALATILPTRTGSGIVAVDIGATMDPKPENLLQYALMGSIYAQILFSLANPRVGLLNIGVEPQKGNELAKQTYTLLEQTQLNFIGNIEAREVLEGRCDVLVCDGFVGNVLIKAMEGLAQSLFSEIKTSVQKGGIKGKVGGLLLKKSLLSIKNKLDYSQHGGSPLVGINGVCIKCHGSADAITVKNAILKQAVLLVGNNTVSLIKKVMEG